MGVKEVSCGDLAAGLGVATIDYWLKT